MGILLKRYPDIAVDASAHIAFRNRWVLVCATRLPVLVVSQAAEAATLIFVPPSANAKAADLGSVLVVVVVVVVVVVPVVVMPVVVVMILVVRVSRDNPTTPRTPKTEDLRNSHVSSP